MKWPQIPDPKEGDVRWVKKFALLPKLLDREKMWIWLEHYYKRLSYESPYEGPPSWRNNKCYSQDPIKEYGADFEEKWEPSRWHQNPPDVSVVIKDLKDKKLLAKLALSPREDLRLAAQAKLKTMKTIQEEEEII